MRRHGCSPASTRCLFSKAHLPSGYGAPYELQQLELHDQNRMAPLKLRAHAAFLIGVQVEATAGLARPSAICRMHT